MSAESRARSIRTRSGMRLEFLEGLWAVSRLEADAALPAWACEAEWFSISRTADELSIVSPAHSVPAGVMAEMPWTMFRVAGQLDFDEVGILAQLTRVLAEADIAVFVVSTFDTDYILVRDADATGARDCLELAGHQWDDSCTSSREADKG